MDEGSRTPLEPVELERRERDLADVIEVVRPAMRADGGDLELVDAEYDTGVVRVRMIGACGSCAVAGMTLTDGVERILKQRLSWVSEVVGELQDSEVKGYGGWVGRD
jgi:Fe-S cluster biogenesis protein NfuA